MYSAAPDTIGQYLETVAHKVMDAAEVCNSDEPTTARLDNMLDELKEAAGSLFEQIFYLGQLREETRVAEQKLLAKPRKKKKRTKRKS